MGFSIGFDKTSIEQKAVEQGFLVRPAIYKNHEQKQIIARIFDGLDTLITNHNHTDEFWVFRAVDEWVLNAYAEISCFKHLSFEEEAEIRILKVGRSWPKDMQIRALDDGLIPYVDFCLDARTETIQNGENALGIVEVIVGAGLRDNQLTAVDALFRANELNLQLGRAIRKSAIPYVP